MPDFPDNGAPSWCKEQQLNIQVDLKYLAAVPYRDLMVISWSDSFFDVRVQKIESANRR